MDKGEAVIVMRDRSFFFLCECGFAFSPKSIVSQVFGLYDASVGRSCSMIQ